MNREVRNHSKYLETIETPETRAFEHSLDFSYQVLSLMENLNINQSELAEKMGITKQRLSTMLNTQPNLTLATIAKFEIALDAEFVFALRPKGYADPRTLTVNEMEEHKC